MQTFNEFCERWCDGLYDSKTPMELQCTGYKELRRMVVQGIKPSTVEEIERWEQSPTTKELFSSPDAKYLRFIHPILRLQIIHNWEWISKLEL